MLDEITIRFYRTTRRKWGERGPSFHAACWGAEVSSPKNTRFVCGRGDTPGEAADDLMAQLYPAPKAAEKAPV